jgi:hypothetical protein
MTINRKGGKHKHMKRNRNNGDEDRKNPKNIYCANSGMGEFYGKVTKVYGNKRFEIQIIDSDWKEKKRSHTASLRGSRKMRQFERVTLDKIVMVSYDDTIGFMDIQRVYKDWEIDHITKNTYGDSGNPRIVIEGEVNTDAFNFDYSLLEQPEEEAKKDKKIVSIAELTGIASDDEDNDEATFYGNSQPQRNARAKNNKKDEDLDDFIDAI